MDDYKFWYGKDPKIFNAVINLYKLYYKLAKDYFNTKEQVNEETEDFNQLSRDLVIGFQ